MDDLDFDIGKRISSAVASRSTHDALFSAGFPGAGAGAGASAGARAPAQAPMSTGVPAKNYGTSQVPESALLAGYTQVPQSKWEEIPRGTHIRYRKHTGELLRGGFVKNTYTSKTDGARSLYLESSFNRDRYHKEWAFKFADVSEIWAKVDTRSQAAVILEEKKSTVDNAVVESLRSENRELRDRVTVLEDRFNKLMAALKQKFGQPGTVPMPGSRVL